jgi:hypothetical protein
MALPCDIMLGNNGYRWTSAHPDLWRGRRYEVRCLAKLIRETEAEYGPLHADEDYDEQHFEDICIERLLHLYVLPSSFVDFVLGWVPLKERSVARDLEFLRLVYHWYRDDAVEE